MRHEQRTNRAAKTDFAKSGQTLLMNATLKWRVAALMLAIGAFALLIVWAVVTSWERLEKSRALARAGAAESTGITRHFQSTLLELNNHLLRLAAERDTNQWTLFESEWTALNRWLDAQSLSSPTERQLLGQITSVYDDYHVAAAQFRERVHSGEAGLQIHDFAQLQRELSRLVDLASQLGEAHRSVLREALAASRASLTHLQTLLLAALFLLLASASWLAFLVYKQLIAPLQVKLVESRALLERQEKLASLGVLAAGVAHEIRNPLTAIKAWLFLHQRKLQAESQELADAQIVANELNRLERIVKDFLLFARPSEPQFDVIPADRPLREVRDLLSAQFTQANIQIALDGAAAAEIRVDPQQLKQVLINLAQNAADAIGSHGTITLGARLDHQLLGGRERDVVILEVADNGKGIPSEVEQRLFDPFFSTKETGTGLGLSIAARIVQEHGGALQYRTRINHGTTFGIILPRVAT
jgi:signal transduction histidine kinase